MNSSEREEIVGLAQLVALARRRDISLPLAILSPNYSSPLAKIAKSLPIAIRASPSKDQENKKDNQDASPGTPPLVKEIKRNYPLSSTPAVKIVKFSPCKPLPDAFRREEFNVTPRQKPTSALKELFNSPGASSPQFQRRASSDLLSIRVRAPDADLPLSLVVPKDASVLQVIVSILHKLDGSSIATRVDSSRFELKLADEDEMGMGLPALGSNQQIGAFGCTTFELVQKKTLAAVPLPEARSRAPDLREDKSGATAPQQGGPSQAQKVEPRVATASCFHFDEFSASMYKEFDVIKVNRHGSKQLRKMGIDRDKIYNLAPKAGADVGGSGGSKKSSGLLSSLLSSKHGVVKKGLIGLKTLTSRQVSKKSRLIKEVRSIESVEGQPLSFTLIYNEKGGETSTYIFSTNTEEEAADIVARVQFLRRLHARS